VILVPSMFDSRPGGVFTGSPGGDIEDGEATTSHEDAINKEENGDGEAGEEQD